MVRMMKWSCLSFSLPLLRRNSQAGGRSIRAATRLFAHLIPLSLWGRGLGHTKREERRMRSPAGREPANERGGSDTHRPVVWHAGSTRHRPTETGKRLLANHYCSVAIVMPVCQLARHTCPQGESARILGRCAPILLCFI